MSLQAAALLALTLILILFVVAALVEARGVSIARRPAIRHYAYTLALGVYCTSWTFYGAVGSTVRDGWSYLPIYAAPILLLIAAPRLLRRLAQAVAEEQAKTVSDFIAARFGHDIVVARLVTVIALLGTIPYIALQLRSIGAALSIVSGSDVAVQAMLTAAPLLALFAILFGARRFELAGRSEGLLFAIALESAIKLLALVAVAGLALFVITRAPTADLAEGLAALGERFDPARLSLDVGIIFLIAMTAIVSLPRQFYMGLVEARGPDDLVRARGGLALYLAAMAVLVLPIALAGLTIFGPGVAPDLYVLELPAAEGQGLILAAALLGGVSAAASMAIVDSTALATMVSNDLLFPTLIRKQSATRPGAIGRRMLAVRRLSILVIMALGLLWALLVSAQDSLASIGLIAFAAMAQFTPHLLLAATGTGRDPLAARASLSAGLLLWLYTLALPPVMPTGWLDALSGTPLDPLRLFGIGNAAPLSHGVIWSVGINLAIYAAIAARKVQTPPLPRLVRAERPITNLGDLAQLTGSFIGEEQAERAFPVAGRALPVDRAAARRARELIAQVVGASSARALVASALAGGKLSLPEVTRLLDEGGQSLRFSRRLLASTFENVGAGISVVDAELNLVAWNSRYLELFRYPPGLVRVGVPIAELIRHNAIEGDFGPGDIEHHVEKRLEHLRRGQEHSVERHRNDGRVIKIVGGPMPGGGYVMSFTDISEEARVREELRRTLDELEQRVADRTRELSDANRRLARADQDKTRFLAAASHDLLQPLHAARLFTAALGRDVSGPQNELVARVESAIVAAEDLLRSLLDISRIDAGGVTPETSPIALAPFLADLAATFRPMAEARGLAMRTGPLRGTIESDPGLLRSVMQNFLSNAVRYTARGGVLIGVRRRGDHWRIDIVDTGVGIAETRIEEIFSEFVRLGEVEVEGLGLGLALVRRIVRLLGGRIEVRSAPGRGSRFSLYLPAGDDDAAQAAVTPPISSATAIDSRRLRLLSIDNDERIVEASRLLLERLGHEALGARNIAEALAVTGPLDAALVDYQLDAGENGLDLIDALRRMRPGLPVLLVTAENDARMRARAARMGVDILPKPAAPDAINAFLAAVSMRQIEPE
ncbi:MAG: PAS domain-containing hybrid sensor histidine kinase/response regulator [Sphingopyxis sp.]|uniref:PAS domain-containing hybrid sensor histidine kinase/response regulator n=1 Tax=Sphingopyxis sp. TaxID=1908224 RepID=UPI002AB97670|nr:PAS domain-containing hybrid sensor histidine kinase/response regulator [Sphingopyxis sp.]MDZ3832208.1 PAS domain-containing hybrid sensor histidine kinase/response regulator [Sphingopyxis sp.]